MLVTYNFATRVVSLEYYHYASTVHATGETQLVLCS